MNPIPALLALVLASGAAHAQPRPSTLDLSCAGAQALVAREGAAVLSTGPRTFDRFVSHTGFCAREEIAERTFAPTRDDPRCPVAFRCVLRDIETSQN